jgi:stalled ribosome alternative rescue factor ArfA
MTPRKGKGPRKRNIAAKALRSPLFRPRVEINPRAYRRKGKRRTLAPAETHQAEE